MEQRSKVNELREKARQQRQQAAWSFKESQEVDIDSVFNRNYDTSVLNTNYDTPVKDDELFARPPELVSTTSDPLTSLISSTLGDYNNISTKIVNGSYHRLIGDYSLPTTPVIPGDKRLSFPSQDHNANVHSVPPTNPANTVQNRSEQKRLAVDKSLPSSQSSALSGSDAGPSASGRSTNNGRTLLGAENRAGSVWKKVEKDNTEDGLVRRRLHADSSLKSSLDNRGSSISGLTNSVSSAAFNRSEINSTSKLFSSSHSINNSNNITSSSSGTVSSSSSLPQLARPHKDKLKDSTRIKPSVSSLEVLQRSETVRLSSPAARRGADSAKGSHTASDGDQRSGARASSSVLQEDELSSSMEPTIRHIFNEMCVPLPPLITAIDSPRKSASAENGIIPIVNGSPWSSSSQSSHSSLSPDSCFNTAHTAAHKPTTPNHSHHTASASPGSSHNDLGHTSSHASSPASSVSHHTDDRTASSQEKLLKDVAKTLENTVSGEKKFSVIDDAIGYVSSSSGCSSPGRHSDAERSSYDGISSAHDDFSGLSESDDEDDEDETKQKHNKANASKQKPPASAVAKTDTAAKPKSAKVKGTASGSKSETVNDKTNGIDKVNNSNGKISQVKAEKKPFNSKQFGNKTVPGSNDSKSKAAVIKKTFKSRDFITDSSSDDDEDCKPPFTNIKLEAESKDGNTVDVADVKFALGNASCDVITPSLGITFDSEVDDVPCIRVLIDKKRLLGATCPPAEGEQAISTPPVPKPPAYSPETLKRLMGLDSSKHLPKAIKIPRKRAGADLSEQNEAKRRGNDHYSDDRRIHDDRIHDDRQRDGYRGRGGRFNRDLWKRNYEERYNAYNDHRRGDGYRGDHRGNETPGKMSGTSSRSSLGAAEPSMSRQVVYDDLMSDVGEDAEYDPPVLGATPSGLDDTVNPTAADNADDDDKPKPSYKKIGSQWGSMVASLSDAPTEKDSYTAQWQQRYCNRRSYPNQSGNRRRGGRRDLDAESSDSLDRAERRGRDYKSDRYNARPRGGRRSLSRSPNDRGGHVASDRSGSVEQDESLRRNNEIGGGDADRIRGNERNEQGARFQRSRPKTTATQTDEMEGASEELSDLNRNAKELTDAEVQTEKPCPPVESRHDSVIYHQEARRLKHKGDASTDQYQKVLHYTDAILSFIQQAEAMERTAREQSSGVDKIITETITFSKSVFSKYHNGTVKVEGRRWTIAIILSYRIQSYLYYQLFRIRKQDSVKAKPIIDEICTSKSSEPQDARLVPSVKRYVGALDSLLRSHQVHDRACSMSAEYTDFFESINMMYGDLHTDSSAAKLIAHVKECLKRLSALNK